MSAVVAARFVVAAAVAAAVVAAVAAVASVAAFVASAAASVPSSTANCRNQSQPVAFRRVSGASLVA